MCEPRGLCRCTFTSNAFSIWYSEAQQVYQFFYSGMYAFWCINYCVKDGIMFFLEKIKTETTTSTTAAAAAAATTATTERNACRFTMEQQKTVETLEERSPPSQAQPPLMLMLPP